MDNIYKVHLRVMDGITPVFAKINNQIRYTNIAIARLKSNMTGLSLGSMFGSKLSGGIPHIRPKVLLDTSIAQTQAANLQKIAGKPIIAPVVPTMTKSQAIRQGIAGAQYGPNAWKAALLVGGMGYAIASPVRAFSEYEDAFKNVRKAISRRKDESPEKYNRSMRALFRQMENVRGIPFTDVAKIVTESGKMGFDAETVLPLSINIIKGAKALDFDAGTAAYQIGRIMSMSNLMGTDVAVESSEKIVDIIAHLENEMPGVKAANTMNVWERTVDRYSALDFDLETMGGFSAFLTQNVPRPEKAATYFHMMMNRFAKTNDMFGFYDEVKEGGISGLNYAINEIKKLSKKEQIDFFGIQGMKLIEKLLDSENWKKLIEAIELAKNAEGTMNREWAVYIKTFTAKKLEFVKSWKNMLSSIGGPLSTIPVDLFNFLDPKFVKIKEWIDLNVDASLAMAKWLKRILYVVGAFALLSTGIWLAVKAFRALGWVFGLGGLTRMISDKSGLTGRLLKMREVISGFGGKMISGAKEKLGNLWKTIKGFGSASIKKTTNLFKYLWTTLQKVGGIASNVSKEGLKWLFVSPLGRYIFVFGVLISLIVLFILNYDKVVKKLKDFYEWMSSPGDDLIKGGIVAGITAVTTAVGLLTVAFIANAAAFAITPWGLAVWGVLALGAGAAYVMDKKGKSMYESMFGKKAPKVEKEDSATEWISETWKKLFGGEGGEGLKVTIWEGKKKKTGVMKISGGPPNKKVGTQK